MARSPTQPPRSYADSSVFGGCFDSEFEADSRRFFDLVHAGYVLARLSDVVRNELLGAPPRVQGLLASLPEDRVQSAPLSEDLFFLRDAYLAAGIVGRRSRDDAAHVAAATVARADAIVSGSSKHIVSLVRIRGYNQVNLGLGYGILTILTPEGVLRDDEQ